MSPATVEGGADQATRLRELVASLRREEDAAQSRQAPESPVAPMVVIASGKGGVGKTNLAVNLSVALSQRGEDVVLVDADVGLANADVLCGLSPRHRLDAGRVRRGGLSSITVEAPGGFRLVPGGSGTADLTDPTATQRGMLAGAIDGVRRECSVLLVDSSAGAGRCVTELVSAASLALLVTTPEPTAVADVYGLLKCLALRHPESGSESLSLVVNQAHSEAEARAVHARLDAVSRRFLGRSVPMLGWIAQDPRVPQSVRQRVPVVLNASRSPAARSVHRLARQTQSRLQAIS